jgi:pyruvate ferredoxin oxidoreductase gamma subunit
VVLNSSRPLGELGLVELAARLPVGHAVTLPATELAMAHVGRAVPNAALLGALAGVTGVVSLQAVQHAFAERFPAAVAEANAAAAAEAYRLVHPAREAIGAPTA